MSSRTGIERTVEAGSRQSIRMADFSSRYCNLMQEEALRLLGDRQAAKEVLQVSLQRVMEHAERVFQYPASELGGLARIVSRNAALERRPDARGSFYGPLGDEEREMLLTLAASGIRFVPQLRPSYQDILLLKYYYKLPDAASAGLLGISEKNARIRVYRAKKKLRELEQKEAQLL